MLYLYLVQYNEYLVSTVDTDGAGPWNLSFMKTRTDLSCAVHNMVADASVMQGARTTAAVIDLVIWEYSGFSTWRVDPSTTGNYWMQNKAFVGIVAAAALVLNTRPSAPTMNSNSFISCKWLEFEFIVGAEDLVLWHPSISSNNADKYFVLCSLGVSNCSRSALKVLNDIIFFVFTALMYNYILNQIVFLSPTVCSYQMKWVWWWCGW